MNNVADRLRTPTRRVPWIVGGVGALALVAAAIIAGPSIAAQINPAPTPSVTIAAVETVTPLTAADLDSIQQAATDQQATIAADEAAQAAAAEATRQAALAAAHQRQDAGGPVKCAVGYTANAVDADGNESNCQKNGPGGGQCVAYDDANNCTQYYKPKPSSAATRAASAWCSDHTCRVATIASSPRSS